MKEIPSDGPVDGALRLALRGYRFIPDGCRRHASDVFQTRIFLQPVICMSGPEAAEVFYDQERFTRQGAAPKRIQRTLFGENGVQSLDGAAHRHRKQMFMSLMTNDSIRRLAEGFENRWREALPEWEQRGRLVLFPEVRKVLCRAVCEWAGVPLEESGELPAGAVPGMGRGRLQLHPPGRGRSLREPPLRRGVDQHRADEKGGDPFDRSDGLPRSPAEPRDLPVPLAGLPQKRVRDRPDQANGRAGAGLTKGGRVRAGPGARRSFAAQGETPRKGSAP